jgi:amino acid adenylation domain-containing protein
MPQDRREDLPTGRAELERRLAEKRAEKERLIQARRIQPVPRDGSLPCTYQQDGAWFIQQLDPQSSTYHISIVLKLRGELDVAALERAWHALVVRHEALRTRFVDEGGVPRQVIDPPPASRTIPVVELPAEEIEQWTAGEIRRPMDLATGPLLRTSLARVTQREHVLVFVVNHIVCDGWSMRVLAGELSMLYSAETGSTEARLPELPFQPADHAVWQRRWLDGERLDRQRDYWRTRLADLSTIDLPADRPRPAEPQGTGAFQSRNLPDDLAAAARAYARANSVSFLALMKATLLTVLHRYTGQSDLPIGSVFSGRNRADLEPLVGFFVNPMVLRTSLEGDPSFAELVRRCNYTVLEATEHQDIPFSLVVDTLQPDRVAGRNPLFQVALTLQPAGATVDVPTLGEITTEVLDSSGDHTRFDLNVLVVDGASSALEVSALYSTELFDPDRIDRFISHFSAALAHGLREPDRPVTALEFVSDSERHQVLHAWNDTAVDYPAQPLHRSVEAAASATPDAVAVVDHDGTSYTYRQLDSAANQLAHRLRRQGVGPNTRVGVCLQRGVDLVTALLATWRAGGAYVPLEPDLPPQRLDFLIEDATPVVVVTDAAHASSFPAVIALDTERSALAAEPTTAPTGGAGLDDPAYLLYTSGSTGTPKAVQVPHRGVHNRIAWMQDTYRLHADDRVLQKTPYGFDVSVWEFFWPLVTGATLVLAKPGGHGDPRYLHQLITREGITTLHFVPTMLNNFLDAADSAPLPSLRRVFCSGEALAADTVRRFSTTWPDIEMHNLYGPTEASIDVTAWRCTPDPTTVPIGRPIANIRTYVLDDRLRPAPIGVPGQLFLAGVGLAHGYHHRPALTAQRFLPDPYGPPGRRMYATGDLVRWRTDGVLEYLGRQDGQVKIGGQRIELGEVEHVLAQHPDVRQCAIAIRDAAYLAAYVVGDVDLGTLRAYVAERLPAYMTPTAWVALTELPVTHSGKLDTALLPEPERAAPQTVAPRTETERWLADTWRDLLGVERVGVDDDFFALGANSLHATQLTVRIRDHLNIELAPRHLFTSSSLEQLATLLDKTEATPAIERILPVPRNGPLVCTFQQEGLWLVQQLDPTSAAYNIGFATRLRGAMQVPALEQALGALVARHEALRTRFEAVDGLPRQVIDPPPAALTLPVVELAQAQVERWATDIIRRPMDLATGPLYNVALARLAPDEHVLVVVVHHIVADGMSARILVEELAALYAAGITGDEVHLPDLPVQPADHAAWQRGWLTGEELERQLGYWRERLADLPTVDFPTDRPRPARPTGMGAGVQRRLPDDLAAGARAYARRNQVSFLAVLQAALLVVLNRYTGQTDLPVGSVFSGRNRAELEPLVGYFVNAVVLRTNLDGEPTFAEVVRRCHETVVDATANQAVPFSLIVDALEPDRTAGGNPLFQIALSLLPAQRVDESPRFGDFVAEPVEATTGHTRFDLAINVDDVDGGGLDLEVEYSTELFDADRIHRLVEHFTTALANGLTEPDGPAEDIEIMSLAERREVLYDWNPARRELVTGAAADPGEAGA